jgi:DNA-binding GntR family transcriptional regulator
MSARLTGWGAYREIADSLRERLTGTPGGTAVPSEAALCAEFRVVRNTARRALALLEDEGLIESVPGRGRVVRGGGSQTAPVYRRIADELRTEITSGRLAAGDKLPSEATLTERHDVARATVRQALAVLEAEGLIEAVQGRGRFVSSR